MGTMGTGCALVTPVVNGKGDRQIHNQYLPIILTVQPYNSDGDNLDMLNHNTTTPR